MKSLRKNTNYQAPILEIEQPVIRSQGGDSSFFDD